MDLRGQGLRGPRSSSTTGPRPRSPSAPGAPPSPASPTPSSTRTWPRTSSGPGSSWWSTGGPPPAAPTASTATASIRLVDETLEAARLRPVDPDWPGLAPPTAWLTLEDDRYDPATERSRARDPGPGGEGLRRRQGTGDDELRAAGYCATKGWEVYFANNLQHRAGGRASSAAVDAIHRTPDVGLAGAGRSRPSIADIDGAAAGRLAAERARAAANPVDLEPGRYEVVLEPACVADMLDFLADGFNAKTYAEGRSWVEAQGGPVRRSPSTSGTTSTTPGPSACRFDAEGTPKAPARSWCGRACAGPWSTTGARPSARAPAAAATPSPGARSAGPCPPTCSWPAATSRPRSWSPTSSGACWSPTSGTPASSTPRPRWSPASPATGRSSIEKGKITRRRPQPALHPVLRGGARPRQRPRPGRRRPPVRDVGRLGPRPQPAPGLWNFTGGARAEPSALGRGSRETGRRMGISPTTSPGCGRPPTSWRSRRSTSPSSGWGGGGWGCARSTPRSRGRSRSTPRRGCTTASAAGPGATPSASCRRSSTSTSPTRWSGWRPGPASRSTTTPSPCPRSASGGRRCWRRWRRRSSGTTSACSRAATRPPARAYLRSRGYDGDVVRAYRLGWAPDDWDALSKALRLPVRRPPRRRPGPDQPHRPPAGRVPGPAAVPHLRRAGRRHRLRRDGPCPGPRGPSTRTRPSPHLYAKSRTLYGLNWAKADIVTAGEVVVCEGYTDVIGLAAVGRPRAVATCGTALTEDHFRTAQELRPPGGAGLRRRRRRPGRGGQVLRVGAAVRGRHRGGRPARRRRPRRAWPSPTPTPCGRPSTTPGPSSPSASSGPSRAPTCAPPRAGPRRPRRPWPWSASTPATWSATST